MLLVQILLYSRSQDEEIKFKSKQVKDGSQRVKVKIKCKKSKYVFRESVLLVKDINRSVHVRVGRRHE